MDIYLAIKYHADLSNRSLIEAITAALETPQRRVFCVARDLERWGALAFTPAELMEKSFAAIRACDLLLVEISEKGVGLGIEAGYAYAHGIPILALARTGSDIPATLQGIAQEVRFYPTEADLPAVLNDSAPRRGVLQDG